MTYKTHLLSSFVAAIPIMTATDTMSVSAAFALSLGTLLPDIDEPRSWIGRRTRGISDLIRYLFGHRAETHSVTGIGVIALFTIPIVYFTSLLPVTAAFFVFGYFMHIFADSFSKDNPNDPDPGIRWFLPFSSKAFHSGFGILYYRTGKLSEALVFIVLLVVLARQLNSIPIPPLGPNGLL